MLAITVVEEIDRLLKDGQLSQRKIAAKLGVSRGTVSAMANGQRGVFGREEDSERQRGIAASLGIAARCCRCGYLVYMPCLICRTREHRQNPRPPRVATAAPKNRVARGRRQQVGAARPRSRAARVA